LGKKFALKTNPKSAEGITIKFARNRLWLGWKARQSTGKAARAVSRNRWMARDLLPTKVLALKAEVRI